MSNRELRPLLWWASVALAAACSVDDGDFTFGDASEAGAAGEAAVPSTGGGAGTTGSGGLGEASEGGAGGTGGTEGEARGEAGAAGDGDDSEVESNECADDPCLNGGECVDGPGRYACDCTSGFSGENCETAVSGCDDDPCLNDGLCSEHGETYQCECADGFRGENCSVDIDDCAGDPCHNGGACVDGIAGYACNCEDGFTGNDCEDDVDECADDPCPNGQCVNRKGSYECDCPPEWTGDDCEVNRDECLLGTDSCQNGSACVDEEGGYACDCTPRYHGERCEILKFRGFGVLPDHSSSAIQNLSRDGRTIIGQSSSTGTSVAVRMVDFGPLEAVALPMTPEVATTCWLYGISGNGKILGGECSAPSGFRPYQYTSAGSAYLSMWPLLGDNGVVRDVSADGTTMVGGFSDTVNFVAQAMIETSTHGTSLIGTLTEAESSTAWGVSGDGSIVIGDTQYYVDNQLVTTPWYWRTGDSAVTPFSAPLAWGARYVADISTDGTAVAGSALIGGELHAVRWTLPANTARDLGLGQINATSEDGQVVGGSSTGGAALWRGDGAYQLITEILGDTPDLAGWTLSQVMSISDDGKTIVGSGIHAGEFEGWIVQLP